MEQPTAPSVRTFKARQGRISALTSNTLAGLGDRYLLDPETAFDVVTEFGNDHPVIVEIGCGFGDATVAMAHADEGVNIVAIDVHTRGIARLLQRLDEHDLANVRAMHGDAVPYLRDAVPPGSLAGARIYFPDPWPKARHIKRRLVQPDFIALLTSRIAPGGLLHCATDWSAYAHQMLEVLSNCPDLENTHDGFAPRPSWRPLTRYERAGLDKGHDVYDLVFRRR